MRVWTPQYRHCPPRWFLDVGRTLQSDLAHLELRSPAASSADHGCHAGDPFADGLLRTASGFQSSTQTTLQGDVVSFKPWRCCRAKQRT